MALASRSICFELLHCLASLVLDAAQLFDCVTFLNCQSTHKALVTLNVSDVQVDLLLENDKLHIHLDFQVISSGLNLSLQLNHFFFLQQNNLVRIVLAWEDKVFLPDRSVAFCASFQRSSA